MTSPAPIACTLEPLSQKERLEEIAALMREGLADLRQADLRLELDFRAAVRARVERMVEQERACCAFLDFAVSDHGDVVCVTIIAPEAARGAAEAIFDAFLSQSGKPSVCGCC